MHRSYLKVSGEITLVLLVITMFTVPLAMLPEAEAQAQNLNITLFPSQGPVGTIVTVYGLGFPQNVPVIVTFNGKSVSRTSVGMFGRISATFSVPQIALGSYSVTAASESGAASGSAFFTVTEKSAVSQKPSTSSSIPSGSSGAAGVAGIWLSYAYGPSGTMVTVTGQSFTPSSSVTINFDTSNLATAVADSSGVISSSIRVPSVSPGIYIISASATGKYATATFTVTTAGTGLGPNQQAIAGSSGFWSPLTTGVVAVVVVLAVLLPIIFIIRRRRGREELPPPMPEERPLYKPPTPTYQPTYLNTAARRPTAAPHTRYTPPAYSQTLARKPTFTPTLTPGYSSSRYSQPQVNMKTCRHCKQSIREDYNICPICHKRLR